MKRLIAILLTATVFFGCEESEFQTNGNYYYLKHKGADFPVWITGNPSSDVVLITVHGGPGDSGMGFSISKGFQYLEEDFTVVYWDQRFSGMTQGHYDKETLNPDQFIEDTEKIVEFVRQKLPGKSYFLMGHSWGGQLSAGYLGRDNHDDLFKGWIDLNGSISADLESQWMKEWILERVPAKLAEPDADVDFWQWIIDYYEENPSPGNYSDIEPYLYVSALKGDAVNWEQTQAENPIPYGTLIFKSMFSFSYYVYGFGEKEDMQQWDVLDYTPELGNIDIPALMLWGAEDGVVPVKVADHVYANLATPIEFKSVVKIPECAHGPFMDQPEQFYQEVSQFINTYK